MASDFLRPLLAGRTLPSYFGSSLSIFAERILSVSEKNGDARKPARRKLQRIDKAHCQALRIHRRSFDHASSIITTTRTKRSKFIDVQRGCTSLFLYVLPSYVRPCIVHERTQGQAYLVARGCSGFLFCPEKDRTPPRKDGSTLLRQGSSRHTESLSIHGFRTRFARAAASNHDVAYA